MSSRCLLTECLWLQAAGGVRVAKVMGTTLGPSVFFTGFNQVGVRIDNGHEVMLTEAWLAECYWSANGPCVFFVFMSVIFNGKSRICP